MDEKDAVTLTAFTADTLVHEGPALLTSVVINASVAGGDVLVYDGVDTTGGVLKLHLDGAVNQATQLQFNPPAFFSRGIYADIGSNVTLVTVAWKPLPYGTLGP